MIASKLDIFVILVVRSFVGGRGGTRISGCGRNGSCGIRCSFVSDCHTAVAACRDKIVRPRETSARAAAGVTPRWQGDEFTKDTFLGPAGRRILEATLVTRRVHWLYFEKSRACSFVEKMPEEDLECWCVGTEGSNVQFEKGCEHQVPRRPCHVVRFVEDPPAKIRTYCTHSNATVTDGKHAKESEFLSQWNAQIPVQ